MAELASLSLPFEDWTSGISGLVFEEDSGRLTALSDRGAVTALDLTFDHGGTLTGAHPHGSQKVHSDGLGHAGTMDIEAGAQMPDGHWLLSLERPNRLASFAGRGVAALAGTSQPWPAPAGLAAQPINKGAEAMALLPDGRVLLIGEAPRDGLNPLWLGGPDGWLALGYATSPGFAPVEAALHPCGGLLVLERAANLFLGLTARLVFVPAEALARAAKGAVIVPETIGPVEPTTGRGNFEAMAVAQAQNLACPGPIDVFIASDDNKIRLLPRTLAQYRITPHAAGAPHAAGDGS